MEESEDSVNKDRILFEGFPTYSVFEAELGHLPFVLIRFENREGSEEGLDFIVTVGGGSPIDILETADFLHETAELLETVKEKAEIGEVVEEPALSEETDEWGTTLF